MVETLKLSENMQEARRKNDPIESSPYQETEQEAHRWNTGHGRFASNMSDRHVLAPTEPFKPVVGREIYMCRCCTQWQEFLGPKHAKMRKIECLYMYQFQDINEFNGDHDYPARKIQPALPQNHVHALDKAENLPCEETEGEVRAYPAAGDGEQHDLQEERKQRELDQTVPYQEKSTTSEKVDSAIDGHVRTSSMLNGRNGDSDMSAVSGAVVQHLGLDGRHPLDSIPKQASNKNVKKRQRNRKKRNMEPEPHLWLFSYQLRLFLSIYNWWQNWRPSSSAGARNNAAMNCRKTNPACPVSSRRVKKTRRKRRSSLNHMTEIPQLNSPVTYVVMQNDPVYKFPKRGASSNDFTSLMMKGASVCRPGSGSGGQIEGTSVHGITDVLSAVSSLLTDAYFSAAGKLWSAVVDTGSALLTPIVNRLQPSVRVQHKMSRLARFLIAYVVVWGEDEASDMADPGQVQQGGHHEMMNFLDMLNILARLPPGTCVATPRGVIITGNGLQPVNGHYRESAEFATLNRLGSGGYGVVFSCRDQTTNKLFAMKLIHLQNFDRREVEVPLGLQSRHVIDIYGIVVDGSAVKIFMELADGGMWLTAAARRNLTAADICRMLREALLALDQCRKAGVAHCDLKLENLLLRQDGSTVLTDFGSSNGPTFSPKTTGRTRMYIPPDNGHAEESPGERQERWMQGDMWSLGLSVLGLHHGPQTISAICCKPGAFIPVSADPGLIDLLWKLLLDESRERLTASQALDHPYFTDTGCMGAVVQGAAAGSPTPRDTREADFAKWTRFQRRPKRSRAVESERENSDRNSGNRVGSLREDRTGENCQPPTMEVLQHDPTSQDGEPEFIDNTPISQRENSDRISGVHFGSLREDHTEGDCPPTTIEVSQHDATSQGGGPVGKNRPKIAGTPTSGYNTSNWPADFLDITILCKGKDFHLPFKRGAEVKQLISRLEGEDGRTQSRSRWIPSD